jgi:hypothetical protein
MVAQSLQVRLIPQLDEEKASRIFLHRTGFCGSAFLQRVASILVCPQVDVTSANQTSPSSRIAHVHHAMWITFTETRCIGSLLGRDMRAKKTPNVLARSPKTHSNRTINRVLSGRNRALLLHQQTTGMKPIGDAIRAKLPAPYLLHCRHASRKPGERYPQPKDLAGLRLPYRLCSSRSVATGRCFLRSMLASGHFLIPSSRRH